ADAFGLAIFAATGAQVAELAGVGPVIAVFLGAMTGVAGGAMRDVLCAEVPLILRRQIYATAALAGATGYVLASAAGLVPAVSLAVGATTAFLLRLAAIGWGLHLPVIEIPDEDDGG
ncbi:MAG TPA: TRIC cation channel family protein, partial [Gemmatimonadales bacterium]